MPFPGGDLQVAGQSSCSPSSPPYVDPGAFKKNNDSPSWTLRCSISTTPIAARGRPLSFSMTPGQHSFPCPVPGPHSRLRRLHGSHEACEDCAWGPLGPEANKSHKKPVLSPFTALVVAWAVQRKRDNRRMYEEEEGRRKGGGR